MNMRAFKSLVSARDLPEVLILHRSIKTSYCGKASATEREAAKWVRRLLTGYTKHPCNILRSPGGLMLAGHFNLEHIAALDTRIAAATAEFNREAANTRLYFVTETLAVPSARDIVESEVCAMLSGVKWSLRALIRGDFYRAKHTLLNGLNGFWH
jgi:hypothetical protein